MLSAEHADGEHSPLFLDLMAWIDQNLDDGMTYNDYLIDLLQRIEDHFDKDGDE